jgi:hypothetical protein
MGVLGRKIMNYRELWIKENQAFLAVGQNPWIFGNFFFKFWYFWRKSGYFCEKSGIFRYFRLKSENFGLNPSIFCQIPRYHGQKPVRDFWGSWEKKIRITEIYELQITNYRECTVCGVATLASLNQIPPLKQTKKISHPMDFSWSAMWILWHIP